jgi:hypothetical protein
MVDELEGVSFVVTCAAGMAVTVMRSVVVMGAVVTLSRCVCPMTRDQGGMRTATPGENCCTSCLT